MFFNEYHLKVYYEMKKEHMEKAMIMKNHAKKSTLDSFFEKMVKNRKSKKIELGPTCCKSKLLESCCIDRNHEHNNSAWVCC